MVWQRSGTVAVQTGSNTVIGTNVDFAASSRNGDSFVGPDGATYEVANVASGTVISILPAYKGPTVSGAAYAIMPVQGYDKALSDAFNLLVNQFGTKLAALGTTGNYDILPPDNGGTGNATGTAAKLAAEAILGTVSQVGGVPNGALMQYTSSVNGDCWRFASGLQICTKSVVMGPVNLSAGPLFTCISGANSGFTANFVAAPVVIPIGVVTASGGGWGSCYSFPTLGTWGAWAVYNHASNSGPSRIDLIAIGRWF